MNAKNAVVLFRPSRAEQIMQCPRSLMTTIGRPDTSSWEASEGSVAHLVHEDALKQLDPQVAWDWLGRRVTHEGFEIEVDIEMVTHVIDSVEWCLEYPGVHYSEARVDVSRYTPLKNQTGTCDHRFIFREKKLAGTTDLKYGKGVRKYAKRNAQLALYMLASLDELDPLEEIETVLIRISQPRLDHRDVWEVSVAELREFGEEIRQRQLLALSPDAHYGPDYHACKFCKRRDVCDGRAQQLVRLMTGEFMKLDQPVLHDEFTSFNDVIASFPEPRDLSSAELAAIHRQKAAIKDFLEKVDHQIEHRLMHAQDVPSLKVVEGRGRNVYEDEAGARRFMLIEQRVSPRKLFSTKFASPSQAMKALPAKVRKTFADAFVRRLPGKPAVVDVNDPRPVFHLTPESLFGKPEDEYADE